jgi:hypothetical protein
VIPKKRIIPLYCLALSFLTFLLSPCPAWGNPFSPFVESFPNGKTDWDSGCFYGTGIGYPHLNEGSKARALKVAQAGALSAILQVAARLRVDDKQTLRDLERDRAIIRIKALVHYEPYGREFIQQGVRPFYRVTYRAPMKGVKGLTKKLLTHLRSQNPGRHNPGQEGPQDADESSPWLVLDARGLGADRAVKPAVFPKIVTEKGETVYDLTVAEEGALAERGMARYVVSDKSQEEIMVSSAGRAVRILSALFSPSPAQAEERRKRKRRGRYIIKNVKQAQGLMKTNLVISESDATDIKEEDASSRILEGCRVIVIVSGPIGGIEGRSLPFLALGR